MKAESGVLETHPWVTLGMILFGLGVLALATFWIKKWSTFMPLLLHYLNKKLLAVRSHTMFNLYQSLNKKDDPDKEPQVIGHERWYQERPSRSSTKKKKRAPRRCQSAGEFSNATLKAATRRVQYQNRSQSSENKSVVGEGGKCIPQRVDSLGKLIMTFTRQSTQTKHEYSAVKTDGGPNEKLRNENRVRNGAYLICKNLDHNGRYELLSQLDDIGSRPDKHWFTVQDKSLSAERLLTIVPIPSNCPISPSLKTRDILLELFRGLRHPYIHPILDIDFWDAGAALVSPVSPTGSLRDLIYGSYWQDDYEKKHPTRGESLSLRTVQCLGRQILEALMFLRNRQFPPVYHLHSGNIIIQHGVARLAGLENCLLGLPPRAPSAPETLALGYLLFEMAAGYELSSPPTPAHLQLELEMAPLVADALELIFQNTRTPNLEEIARCDLFRGVELRELRGTSIVQLTTPPEVLELLQIVKNPVMPSPLLRRKEVVVIIEGSRNSRLEDILEEDSDCSECSSSLDGRER